MLEGGEKLIQKTLRGDSDPFKEKKKEREKRARTKA